MPEIVHTVRELYSLLPVYQKVIEDVRLNLPQLITATVMTAETLGLEFIFDRRQIGDGTILLLGIAQPFTAYGVCITEFYENNSVGILEFISENDPQGRNPLVGSIVVEDHSWYADRPRDGHGHLSPFSSRNQQVIAFGSKVYNRLTQVITTDRARLLDVSNTAAMQRVEFA